MNTATLRKISMRTRYAVALATLAGALAVGQSACNQGGQGDRCNPMRSSNECGGGLVCAGNPVPTGVANFMPGQSYAYIIPYCPENYCCPPAPGGGVDFASATSPYCQPGCNGGAAAMCSAAQSAGITVTNWGTDNDGTNGFPPVTTAAVCTFAGCVEDGGTAESCLQQDPYPPEDAGAPTPDAAPDGSSPDAAGGDGATTGTSDSGGETSDTGSSDAGAGGDTGAASAADGATTG